MIKKLIIHIGSHKTGTTSIQNALYANRANLKKQGIDFFCLSPNGSELVHGNAGEWVTFHDDNILDARIIKNFARKLNECGSYVLISTEMLSWIFNKDIIKKFHKDISHYFDDIKIIIYLRRQDRQIISHFQESSKSSQIPSAWFYGSGTKAIPEYRNCFDSYFDYDSRISLWETFFGIENLIIRIFEPDSLNDKDVVSDFFATFKLDYKYKVKRSNKAYGFKQTKINHLMNQQNTRIYFRNIISQSIKDHKHLSPSRSDAWEFYRRFRGGNRKLNFRYNINSKPYLFDEDFDFYPEKSQDEWDEDTSNNAISDLLNAFENVPLSKNSEIDLVRDAALIIETINLDMASKLMRVAYRLRPDGEGIKKKVLEYDAHIQSKQANRFARIKFKLLQFYRLLRLFIKSMLTIFFKA